MSLHDFLQRDPGCIGLAEGAVHAVAPLLDDPDPAPLLETLEGWAFELAGRMPLPWNFHEAVDALNAFLFQEQGLRGDRETYDDPENAVLSRVIERKRGLPISLSILWMDQARRLGFEPVGIALPGHFIVGLKLDVGALYFDPFNGGRAVGQGDAERLVQAATGGRATFDPAMLEPASHRSILARLVRNLHVGYVRRRNWDEALWTSTHLVLLMPGDPASFRDRAFVRHQRGEESAALADLQEAIRLSPEGDPELARWAARLRGE